MSYPLPPEMLPSLPKTLVGALEMEPGLKRLTDSPGRDVGAVYSPKGDKIVWVTDSLGNWTIWIMNDDGTGKKQLTSSNMISGWPSWSPDGQKITYWVYDSTSKTCDIWKMKADGSSKVKLTTDGTLKEPPAWSPRGDRIAYISNKTGNMEVYVMNQDGGGEKQLTKGHVSIGFGCYIQGRVCWHPDGERLYFEEATFPIPLGISPVVPGDVATVAIHVINVDTGYEKDLTPRCHDYPMSFSPDGKKLAIISFRTPNYGLWIMDADGENQTRLTWDGEGDRDPRFSPDGKKIVYWSLAHKNQPDIWMISPDGSSKTTLTTSPYQDVYPSWSADGKKVIFESDRAGSFDIWQLSLDDPISVNVEFEKCAVPGSTGKASLTIKPRSIRDTLKAESVRLHFDWESEGRYAENVSSLPITSKPNGVAQAILEFPVPKNAELGYHFYDVRVQYSVENQAEGRSRIYEHTARDLKVGTPEEYQCQTLYLELGSELDQRYENAMNRSIALGAATSEVTMPLKGYFDYLLTEDGEKFVKANEEYYVAKGLYLAGDYDAALPRLQKVRTILSEPPPGTVTELVPANFLVSAASLSAVTILVIFLLMQSKKKKLTTK